jgi:RNA polymerase sigma-70 factor (ECF subfamily)
MEGAIQMTEWAVRIRAADEQAFESLYRALHHPLKAYARGFVTDDAAADDVVQESFIKLWQSRDSIDESRSIKALLYTMVRNNALNMERSRKTKVRQHEELAQDIPDSVAQSSEVDAEALGSLLDQWIDQLPERQREALRLSRLDGLSHAEVGAIMNVSARTVNNHIVRALKFLRDEIRKYDESLLTNYSF